MSTYAELHARLTIPADHSRFSGAPVDLGGLHPEELGKLWPLLHAALRGSSPELREQAHQVLDEAARQGVVPRLDSATLLATLRAVPSGSVLLDWLLEQASLLSGPPDAALEDEVERLLHEEEDWANGRHALLAIGRALGATRLLEKLAQAVKERHGESLPAREFTVLDGVALPALIDVARGGYYDPRAVEAGERRDPAAALAAEPAYTDFAREVLEEMAGLLDAIHAGTVPYRADGACNPEEAIVLSRAARVAAIRDEAWYPGLIARLLPGACVAPTAAKTAPSQALTVALGHAIEGVPTPEGIDALRQALGVVRHAGLQKKLARNLKPAERALLRRPPVALRLLDADLAPARRRALLARFFEASLVVPVPLPYAQWRARLLVEETAASFARTLVWHAGAAFMLDERDQPVDADGNPLAIDGSTPVGLWHPLDGDEAERAAWRAALGRRRIRQPLRQVFREFYQPVDGAVFAGYALAAPRLLGLARREGWAIGDGALVRRFGEVRVAFGLGGRVYPGMGGTVDSGALAFTGAAGPLSLQEVAPRIVSEACRAVDLLVSVSAFALHEEEGATTWARRQRLWRLAEVADMHAMRRHALAQVLGEHIASGAVVLEPHHVNIGGVRVSMRTGLATRDGAPVDLAPLPAARLAAVPWLPYDEVLLERVVGTVGVLLERGSA